MARMRPIEFPLDGYDEESREKDVYEKLKNNLPELDIVVHEPRVFGSKGVRKPDFVVFSPDYGCVVIEVKNWQLDNIVGVADDGRAIKFANSEETRANPYQTVESYVYALWDHWKTRSNNENIIVQKGAHKGRIPFVVTPTVILMGLQDSDLLSASEKLGLDPELLISEETLNDPEKLQIRLRNLRKVHNNFGEIDTLKEAADFLIPASDKEKSNAEVLATLERLRHSVFDPDTEQMEKCENSLSRLAEAGFAISDWIESEKLEDKGDSGEEVQPIGSHAFEINRVAQDLAERRFRVCFFGTTGAGKSTLTNTLVGAGNDLLREGMGRTTRVITEIKKACREGVDDSVRREPMSSELVYKSEEEVDEEVKNYAHCLGIHPEEIPAVQLGDPGFREWLGTQIETIEKNKLEASEEAKDSARSLKNFLEGWDECKKLMGKMTSFAPGEFDKAEDLIHSPTEKHACYVRKRVIYQDHELTTNRGFELVDAPGVGASIVDTEQTLNFAREADAVVMITQVGFDFMQPDREFLQSLREILPPDLIGRKLVFVLNKITKIKPREVGVATIEEALEKLIDRLRLALEEFGIEEVLILATDAFCAKVAKRCILAEKDGSVSSELEELFEDVKFARVNGYEENQKASRFQSFQESLVARLVDLKYVVQLDNGLFRIKREVKGCEKVVENRLNAYAYDITTLNRKLGSLLKKKKTTEDHLSGFLNNRKDEVMHKIRKNVLGAHLDELVDDFKNKLEEECRKYGPRSGKALEYTKAHIRHEIEEKRKVCRKIWEKQKDESLRKGIPDVVSEHGSGIEWEFDADQLDKVKLKHIDVLGKVVPSGWQGFKAWFWGTNPFTDKGSHDYLLEYVGENYEERCKKDFAKNITEWVEDDSTNFSNQIKERFHLLVDRLESQYEQQIKDRLKKEEDQKVLKKQLKDFSEFVKKVNDSLSDLHQEVARRRPFE